MRPDDDSARDALESEASRADPASAFGSRPGPESQRDVQRLLGRCLLRLQQYESLLRALLIDHDIGGPASDLHARQRRNAEFFGTSTLGQLAGELFDRVIVVDGVESNSESDGLSTSTEAAIRFRFQIRVDADEHVRRKAHLKSLVDLRNALVHHLIQQFDLWSDDGCGEAQRHLALSFDTIDEHYGELRELVQAVKESRSRARAVLESDQWQDFLVDGIDPNGQPHWPHTGIVRALQEAHQAKGLRSAEWMPLTQAVDWIQQHHPDQTPERYGCKSWPDVLSKARVFVHEKRPGPDGRPKSWFRQIA